MKDKRQKQTTLCNAWSLDPCLLQSITDLMRDFENLNGMVRKMKELTEVGGLEESDTCKKEEAQKEICSIIRNIKIQSTPENLINFVRQAATNPQPKDFAQGHSFVEPGLVSEPSAHNQEQQNEKPSRMDEAKLDADWLKKSLADLAKDKSENETSLGLSPMREPLPSAVSPKKETKQDEAKTNLPKINVNVSYQNRVAAPVIAPPTNSTHINTLPQLQQQMQQQLQPNPKPNLDNIFYNQLLTAISAQRQQVHQSQNRNLLGQNGNFLMGQFYNPNANQALMMLLQAQQAGSQMQGQGFNAGQEKHEGQE